MSAELNPIFDLTGRVAVVTGCRRGIGLAMAEALALAGADIIGVSKELEASGSEVESRVRSLGRSFLPLQADFADRREVANVKRKQDHRDGVKQDHLDMAWTWVSRALATPSIGRG